MVAVTLTHKTLLCISNIIVRMLGGGGCNKIDQESCPPGCLATPKIQFFFFLAFP